MGGTADRAQQILSARAARVAPGELRQTYHEQDGKVIVNNYQDVEPHLKYAQDCRRAEREDIGRFGRTGDMHRTMSVPFNVMAAVAKRLGIPQGEILHREHAKRILKELKRGEFAGFRTTERKI